MFILLVLVAISWWRWGGGVWQYCEWRSALPTVLVNRSSYYHETSEL